MKKVMAFGSFDVIHPGHVYFLREAKKLGDCLVVLVARDKTIEKVKGKKPHYSEAERLNQIMKLKIADRAILGSEDNYLKSVSEFAPDIIALGYDQKFPTDELKKSIPQHVKIARIGPYKEHIYKSSLIKKKN
ncbi:MAG TPA: adenylyltransferase/cytidyltransferase family protein [Candidatus Nanoarchaeia archaeon]|nr:adenylyltransferase/cytidyltransferase family protein [Candidatus Nanoarchaeia archaeon]